jgi:hypothetical protein
MQPAPPSTRPRQTFVRCFPVRLTAYTEPELSAERIEIQATKLEEKLAASNETLVLPTLRVNSS